METAELLKKVRKIEIKTRNLSQQIFSGRYHSAFKGRGMAFSEVREYNYGDDVRFIDWNVTARFNHPYVKVFEEERELTVMLLIDVSASNTFGSQNQLKRDVIAEISAVLSFSATQNNDKVGILFFSDVVEKYIPPKKGKSHILRIIRELVNFQASHTGTNINEALRLFTNVHKRKCTVFLISDFQDSKYEDAIKIVSKKHDLSAIYITDPLEKNIPDLGILRIQDAETGQKYSLDSSSSFNRKMFTQQWEEKHTSTLSLFNKYGIRSATIETNQDYIKSLIQMFQQK